MQTEMVRVKLVEGYGLIVTFSDGTYANYVVEELISLRPHREVDSGLLSALLSMPTFHA